MESTGAQAPVDAHEDLGWALGTLLRAYVKVTAEALADLPGGARGFQVLMTAGAGSCGNQAAIAGTVGLDRTVMTYLTDDLEAAGLVVRTPDPSDRRSRRVSLTDAGRLALDAARHRVNRAEDRLFAELQGVDRDALREVVLRAARSAESADSAPQEVCDTIDAVAR